MAVSSPYPILINLTWTFSYPGWCRLSCSPSSSSTCRDVSSGFSKQQGKMDVGCCIGCWSLLRSWLSYYWDINAMQEYNTRTFRSWDNFSSTLSVSVSDHSSILESGNDVFDIPVFSNWNQLSCYINKVSFITYPGNLMFFLSYMTSGAFMNINCNKCQPPTPSFWSSMMIPRPSWRISQAFFNSLSTPPPSMASSKLWLIQSSGSAPSWRASQASVIMWLLPGSCSLTLLLDIWQFLIQGDKGKDKDRDMDKDIDKDKDKVIMWLLPGSCNLTLLLDIWQFLIQGDKRQRQRQRYLQRHRQGQGQGHYVAPSWQLQLDLVARYMAVLNSRWQSERQRQRSWQRQRQRQRHSLGPGNCCLTFLLDMAIFNSYQSMRCFFKSQHFYFPIIICSLNIELRGKKLRNIEDMSMVKITIYY